MAKHKRRRPGVLKQAPPAQNAGGIVTISLADLAMPPSAGFADSCHVVDRGLYVEFTFTQLIGHDPHVLARVNMFLDDLLRRFWKPSAAFYEQVLPQIEQANLDLPEISLQPVEGDEAIMASVATLVHVARTGLFAEIGFYTMPPRSLLLSKAGRRLEILPLFSVQTPLPLAMSILRHIDQIRPAIEARLPILLTGASK